MSRTGAPASADGGAAAAATALEQRALRADAQRNYAKLLDAASAAFIEHGADDVSLEEIARRAGVGIGTLYRHFPTRQALLEAVYRDQVELLRARAEELLDTVSPGDAFAAWMRALAAFSSTKRSLTSAMLTTLGKDSEVVSACSRVLRTSAETLLARAQHAGAIRPDVTAIDVIRLVHGITIATERMPTDPAQADRMLAFVLDGLRPQPAG
jgi:AcrR family transcriptional regulator